jgi:hypothetical protein
MGSLEAAQRAPDVIERPTQGSGRAVDEAKSNGKL